ncbi:molybdenum cofactor guanylyltransferase [Lysobacter fragariae]
MKDTVLPPSLITLGILAGGRASRLGGADKAWLERDGLPQVLRWQRRFADEVAATLISANRDLQRYALAGLHAVADRIPGDHGPIAGLDALAAACTTPWLLTIPVDLVGTNDCLLRTLIAERAEHGAFAHDDDGPQPLVALWHVDALREAIDDAIHRGNTAIHALQAMLAMPAVRFAGVRFGNLNTPDDLMAAGVVAARNPDASGTQ